MENDLYVEYFYFEEGYYTFGQLDDTCFPSYSTIWEITVDSSNTNGDNGLFYRELYKQTEL
jgi:hypothetical protein